MPKTQKKLKPRPEMPKLTTVKEWDLHPVPMEQWGKDHWSTLLYIESRCVDGGSKPMLARMRQWPGRPLRGWDGRTSEGGGMPCEPEAVPTRLKDGSLLSHHDDWDCVSDMAEAGLVEWQGTGLQPIIKLTDYGWRVASALRRHRAEKWDESGPGTIATFVYPFKGEPKYDDVVKYMLRVYGAQHAVDMGNFLREVAGE